MDREFSVALEEMIDAYVNAGTSRRAIFEALDLKTGALRDEGFDEEDDEDDNDETDEKGTDNG